jgi:hypothetical protein
MAEQRESKEEAAENGGDWRAMAIAGRGGERLLPASKLRGDGVLLQHYLPDDVHVRFINPKNSKPKEKQL